MGAPVARPGPAATSRGARSHGARGLQHPGAAAGGRVPGAEGAARPDPPVSGGGRTRVRLAVPRAAPPGRGRRQVSGGRGERHRLPVPVPVLTARALSQVGAQRAGEAQVPAGERSGARGRAVPRCADRRPGRRRAQLRRCLEQLKQQVPLGTGPARPTTLSLLHRARLHIQVSSAQRWWKGGGGGVRIPPLSLGPDRPPGPAAAAGAGGEGAPGEGPPAEPAAEPAAAAGAAAEPRRGRAEPRRQPGLVTALRAVGL